jgi:hypothetical protein
MIAMSLASVWRRRVNAFTQRAIPHLSQRLPLLLPFDLRTARGELELNQVGAAVGSLRIARPGGTRRLTQAQYRAQINSHVRHIAQSCEDAIYLRALVYLLGADPYDVQSAYDLHMMINDITKNYINKHASCLSDAPQSCDCRL